MRGSELLEKMELIDTAYLLAAEEAPAPKRRPLLQYGVIAACLCAAFFTMWMGLPHSGNAFSVKAYALGAPTSGEESLKGEDLLDQPEVWGGYFDGENFYVNIALQCDGSNIESVTFLTEEGFFAKQHIAAPADGESVPQLYVGADNRLAMYGTDFEAIGNKLTLDANAASEDQLLFWGMQTAGTDELPHMDEIPKRIDIKAIATFRDGQTQAAAVPIDLSGTGVITGVTVSEEERRRAEEEYQYYNSLPLEKCELLEESVETVTDVYEARTGTSSAFITLHDEMEFDENGLYRSGFSGDAAATGYEVYLPVIRRGPDGSYTGMVYHVPQSLQYKEAG